MNYNAVYKLAYIDFNGHAGGLVHYVYSQDIPFEGIANAFGFSGCIEYVDALPGTPSGPGHMIKRVGNQYVDVENFTYYNDGMEFLDKLHRAVTLSSCEEVTRILCDSMHSKEDSPFTYPELQYVKWCMYFDGEQEKDMWFCIDWKG